MNEEEKDEHAILLNVSRRHLTAEQKVEVAKTLKERHPEWPVSKIAKMLHMQEAQLSVQFHNFMNLDTVEGEDGKQYPASEEAAEQKREAIREEIAGHPEKSDREIAKKTGTSPTTVGTQRKKMVTAYNPSKRDEQALRDPDIVDRLASDEKLSVAGALKEQKRERLSSRPDADDGRGASVIITPADDIPGVTGCRIVRADDGGDPGAKAYVHDGTHTEYYPLAGSGDFRSDECIKMLQHADVVVTNPPFELFREFLLLMVRYEKGFLIVGDSESNLQGGAKAPLFFCLKIYYCQPASLDPPAGLYLLLIFSSSFWYCSSVIV